MPSSRTSFALILPLVFAACLGSKTPVASSVPSLQLMRESEALVVQVRQVDAGIGTGLVVTETGRVLTNHHVIKVNCVTDAATGTETCSSGRYEICVTVDFVASCTPAELLASDEMHDLALLSSSRPFPRAAVFADETLLAPAEEVYAWLGVSDLLPPSLFVGRFVNRLEPSYAPVLVRALVLDLSSNHGGSGGPVFNSQGQVIGLMRGFTVIVNEPQGQNGAALAVVIPAADIVAFLKKAGVEPLPAGGE